jgi:ATP-binding cassette subfamily B protein
LQTLSLRYFDKTPNGDIMSRLTNDVENINSTLSQSVAQLFSSVISVTGVVIIMFVMNWKMALISMISVPMIIAIVKFIAKHSKKYYKKQQKYLGQMNGMIEETLTGQKVIKAYGKEEKVLSEFRAVNQKLKESSINAEIYGGFMGPSMNLMNNIRFAIIVGVGGLLAVNGQVSVGVIAAFISYSKMFGRPLTQIANIYNSIQAAIAGAERVFETMDEKAEIEDKVDIIEQKSMKGKVEFEQVDFGYLPEVKVLKEASFIANSGDTIAIVGPTGAGKTTIINLLTRFYDIDSGRIAIDGIDIRDMKKHKLRQQLGIVLQDTYLFSETVRENIRYGRLNATDQEVEEAAKLAGK